MIAERPPERAAEVRSRSGIAASTVAICLLVLLAYQWLIVYLQVPPVSDFKFFYDSSLRLLQGGGLGEYVTFFQGPGYFYILAALFWFAGSTSVLLPQLLNAALLVVLLFAFLRWPLVDRRWLVVAGAVAFAVSLDAWSLVPVLCSELPFAFFLLGGLLLALAGAGAHGPVSRGMRRMLLVLAALAVAVSQTIRPVTTVLVILAVAFLILLRPHFIVDGREERLRTYLPRLGRVLALPTAVFLTATIGMYAAAGYGPRLQPVGSGLWNLYVGLNVESSGLWNEDDARTWSGLIGEHGWQPEELRGALRRLVVERATARPLAHLRVVPKKLSILLDQPALLEWSVDKSPTANRARFAVVARVLGWEGWLAVAVSLAAVVVWWVRRRVSRAEFGAACLILGVTANVVAHAALLEVQPRYADHFFLILFWLLPLSAQSVGESLAGLPARLWGTAVPPPSDRSPR